MSGKNVNGGPAKKPRLTSSFASDLGLELALAFNVENKELVYSPKEYLKTIENEMSRLLVFEEQQKEVENEKKRLKEKKKKVQGEKKKVEEEKKKVEEEKKKVEEEKKKVEEEKKKVQDEKKKVEEE